MAARGYVAKTYGFKISIDDGATWKDFSCDAKTVTDTPTAETITWQVACPDGSGSDTAPTSWALAVTAVTDFHADSLWTFLHVTAEGLNALAAWQPDPVNYPDTVLYYQIKTVAAGTTTTAGAQTDFTVTFGVTGSPELTLPAGAVEPFPSVEMAAA